MADAVSKIGLLGGDAFSSGDELIAFTELVQKGLKIGGADTSDQQVTMELLAEAMADGKLGGIMSSENKTPNIGLNQWEGNEYPKRQDFVDDNLIIDTEIKKLQDTTEAAFQSGVDKRSLHTRDLSRE